jgi:hypothetical protein
MLARILDPDRPMPPKGQTPLTAQEKAELVSWLGNGALPGNEACQNLPPAGDLNALTGPEYLPCTPSRSFRAHGAGTAKHVVPPSNGNTADYACFTFPNPFASNEHALAWAPVIDDARVVHHWLLFGTSSPDNPPPGLLCQLAVTNTLVTGWAPGGANIVNDPDVSVNLDFPYYMLQLHYFNPTNTPIEDSSGVAFCTGAPRQNVAGMITLGTNLIDVPPFSTGQAVGTCNENAFNSLALDNATPMTIVRTYPHMHLTGRAFRTEHFGHEDLSNVADWNFDVQVQYPVNPRRVVLPGETLRTTCTYRNPTAVYLGFGAGTDQEMCYDFITAYPYAKARRKCGPFL